MPYTITFDEKFDLEEGDLKCISLYYYDDDMWGGGSEWDSIEIASDVLDYGTIDNTGNVTVIENFDPGEGEYMYVQFGYFIGDELIKSTKLISLDEVSTTLTTNMSDIEYFYAIVENISYGESENTNYEGEVSGQVKILTTLSNYDSYDDYDYSNVWVKIRIGAGQTVPIPDEDCWREIITTCNSNGTFSGTYRISESAIEYDQNIFSDTATVEILNSNIIPTKFSEIYYN